ncbi:hypothetical protein DFH29DRAFT_1056018 [Suillus ampliporus]|nr:hypothetical protein DFH29DRAFT_1056018 [Suillus ampliporus]
MRKANTTQPSIPKSTCQEMSHAFPGSHVTRTPDAASYRTGANPAPLRTPDATSYRAAGRAPLHERAPLLVAPSSNNSNHLLPLRRPSFSSITQPVIHSPSYYRSRAVSSTMRVQHQITSAAPAPAPFLPPPSRVSGSGIGPSSDRSRTSGTSLRQSVPSIDNQTTNSRHKKHHAVHQQVPQPPVRQANSAIQQHPMLRDIALIAAVTAARGDHREFLWYPVWVIAIRDWMFSNSNTASVACNIAPQYLLSHKYNLDPLSPGSVPKPKKASVIPDFAQVLQHVQTSGNGTPILGRQKVILIVENKPELSRRRILSESPFENIADQIVQQAAFAFVSDSSLRAIGVIAAFGAR